MARELPALISLARVFLPSFQARIVALNSHYFLKNGGHCVISIKASCVDSTASPEAVFAQEVRSIFDLYLVDIFFYSLFSTLGARLTFASGAPGLEGIMWSLLVRRLVW